MILQRALTVAILLALNLFARTISGHNGTASDPVIVDGGGEVLNENLSIQNCSYTLIKNFTVKNASGNGMEISECQNVIIKKESDTHKLINDDMKRINLLIRKYQTSKISQVFTGMKDYFSA